MACQESARAATHLDLNLLLPPAIALRLDDTSQFGCFLRAVPSAPRDLELAPARETTVSDTSMLHEPLARNAGSSLLLTYSLLATNRQCTPLQQSAGRDLELAPTLR